MFFLLCFFLLFFLVLFLLFIVFVLILWLIYTIYKWNVDKPYFSNEDYRPEVKRVLEKYKKYKIKQVYLVKEPLKWWMVFFLKICCNHYSSKITTASVKKETLPYHIYFILILKNKKKTKMILLDKTNVLSLKETFFIYENKNMEKISIQNKNVTLEKLLSTTKQRMGKEHFFNWNVNYKKNCQTFGIEIIATLNPSYKCLFQQKEMNQINVSPFSLFLVNVHTSVFTYLQQIGIVSS